MNLKFRYVTANEVECRVAMVKQSGVSLLLYKDARVDQNILDETVGPMNWQRHHSRDNANCTVSIWDEDKKQWIEKEDTGKESYTEAEKGLASDSFKRACFNWGIGRELYTAPFIWVKAGDCIIEDGKKCKDSFSVKSMKVEDGIITSLTIVNQKNVCVYKYGIKSAEDKMDAIKLNEKEINMLYAELSRTGISLKSLLSCYKVTKPEELSLSDFSDAMNKLKDKPAKKEA